MRRRTGAVAGVTLVFHACAGAIEYDVELYGAEKKIQLPFVMGVLADLSGNPTEPLPAVGDRELRAKAIVVATGSVPKMIPGLEPGPRVITSDEALSAGVPKSAIVLGAGSVGVEFASIWASFGATVTIVDDATDRWYNQTLFRVDDAVVRLGVFQGGEFHWHKHDHEDEFFYVVEGKFAIDLEGRTVELGPQQGFTVPKGVLHRTRAPVRSVILMIEGKGVVPTGD